MEKIKEIKELETGCKLVRFNGIKHRYYEFLIIHPHNKNYVLLLDELDQNAYSFYIPTVLEGEFYVNYTNEDVKKHTIKLLESKLERYKTSLGDPTWEDAITETTSEDVYTDVKNNKLDTGTKFIPDYEVLDEEERKDLVDYFEKINGFPK